MRTRLTFIPYFHYNNQDRDSTVGRFSKIPHDFRFCTGVGFPLYRHVFKIKPNTYRKPPNQIRKSKLYLVAFVLFSCLVMSFRRCHSFTWKEGFRVFPLISRQLSCFYIFPPRIVLLLETGLATVHNKTARLLLLFSCLKQGQPCLFVLCRERNDLW